MRAEIVIAESDYIAIARWDEDGGPARDIVYRVVPDSAVSRRFMGTRWALKSYEEEKDSAEETANLEVTELANA